MPSLSEWTPTETPKPCNRNCTFLTLPAEIRLQIYNLLLINRRVDRIEEDEDQLKWNEEEDEMVEIAILQTCKQIYREANPILYSQTVFAIKDPEDMFRLFEKIGPGNFKLIKKLKIRVLARAKLAPWVGLYLRYLRRLSTR